MQRHKPVRTTIAALAPQVRRAPIRNFLSREPRLIKFADHVSEAGIYTVEDFLRAGEESRLSEIRTTPANRKRVQELVERFGGHMSYPR